MARICVVRIWELIFFCFFFFLTCMRMNVHFIFAIKYLKFVRTNNLSLLNFSSKIFKHSQEGLNI